MKKTRIRDHVDKEPGKKYSSTTSCHWRFCGGKSEKRMPVRLLPLLRGLLGARVVGCGFRYYFGQFQEVADVHV